TEAAEGAIVALVVDGAEAESANAGADVAVIANQTPFYGESGGQQGDAGIIRTETAEIAITDTLKKIGDLHVHTGTVTKGRIATGDTATFDVDHGRRASLRAHHSATHLLHEALRRRLGDHVTQKGSMVAPDRLRFDISHPKAIDAGDLRAIEREVNARIRLNGAVDTRLMTPDEAIENGAMALFGEKYGDEVRVVAMGGDDDRFSVELCGGTHVGRTGDIGFFHIIGESAVGAGVRRIEALAGATADAYAIGREDLLAQTALELKTTAEDVPARVAGLLEERKKLERELSDLRRKLATGGGGSSADDQAGGDVTEIGGIKYAPRQLEGMPAKELKSMADEVKKQIGSGVTAIISVDDGKASIVVGVTTDVMEKISAVDLVRVGSAALGGKGGGGRPDMAQAGGPDGSAAQAALDAIAAAIGDAAA
ncbi:unnamed protein product, partial [Discosporangium mesarthrocarpum]